MLVSCCVPVDSSIRNVNGFVPCMRAKLTVAIRSLSVARGTRSPLSSAYYEAIIPLVSVSI
jgi:hypothetical protein